ncbi:Maf family protein [Ancylobacter lacus]|uniref:Maf family protein n=1 Tax=Ancylobacter lacus TaxID=2579970 RepID=UPI001BD03644|nr:Maf family protein [Ancylobacter lacus]MBS7537607.1 Maf family protein [Ancylobacter lacus]
MTDSALGLWHGRAPLVLASRSAARRAMLESARLPFEVILADIDERDVEARGHANGFGPKQIALMLAREKSLAGAALAPGRLVIGADQTLALGNDAFHKPVDRAAAREQLSRLAGHTHDLHAAIAVSRDGETLFSTVDSAHLTMRPLDPATLEAYLDAAGEAVLASVGGYQLEGLGIHLFERVEGAHSTILGMPLLPLLAFLRQEGSLT